jgi:UDP-glucose 4-epimerase
MGLKMRVLITGGHGFIGRYVQAALREAGHEPVVLDRPQNVLHINEYEYEVDAVIHLAGMLGTAELFADFDTAVNINVKGAQRVLEYCRANGARFVGITMPDTGWRNVYQATKLCAVRLAEAWNHNYGVPVSHVRAFNAYGVGQKHGPGHPQKIIPTFATLAWEGQRIPIWGDGEQTVDLVWAGDVARMLVDALGHGECQTFDAGTGVAMSVRSVAESVCAMAGRPASLLEFLPMRLGEHVQDVPLVAGGEGWDALGWKPVHNDALLFETVEWYRPAALRAA